jgi:hypothetical protein
MSADYTSAFTLAQDPTFRGRVEIAMVTAAIAIMAEASTMPGHPNRVVFAAAVLSAPDTYVARFTLAVVQNVAIASNSTDSDIQFTVNSVFNALAGLPSNP